MPRVRMHALDGAQNGTAKRCVATTSGARHVSNEAILSGGCAFTGQTRGASRGRSGRCCGESRLRKMRCFGWWVVSRRNSTDGAHETLPKQMCAISTSTAGLRRCGSVVDECA